ncbi:MAG: DnaJ domain-containing protein [Pseudomonadota bacterium]|nr:DnaJ domain-containing protein [Pseudomonadota bacterium]
MKSTRRNHYRTLHVQPEAPPEIIAASYRTLMTKLRAHPDLGGDPDLAVLLNQAYAVLSDPEKRRCYDAELRRQGRLNKGLREGDGAAGAGSARGPSAGVSGGARGSAGFRESPPRTAVCNWCTEGLPAEIRPDSRCRRCDAPLAPPPRGPQGKHDLFGRRYTQRVARSSPLAVHTAWGQPARAGRLRDLSLTGLSVLVDFRVPVGQLLRFSDDAMDLLAEVVACRSEGRRWVLHARTLQAVFVRRTGAFVSTSA